MNATSEFSSTSGKTQVSIDEALGAVRAGMDRIDAQRAVAYGDLATLRAAKGNLLKRHETLLARKLGGDNPRVLGIQAQREAIGAQLLDLRTAQAVSATPVPVAYPS